MSHLQEKWFYIPRGAEPRNIATAEMIPTEPDQVILARNPVFAMSLLYVSRPIR